MDSIRKYHEEFLKQQGEITEWKSRDCSLKRESEEYKQDELRLLLDAIHHVDHLTMISKLRQQIEGLDPYTKYVLYFPTQSLGVYKCGSENLLILECFDVLNTKNIVGVIETTTDIPCINDEGEINILFVDDCIYTGNHLTTTLDYLTRVLPDKKLTVTCTTYACSSHITSKRIKDGLYWKDNLTIIFHSSLVLEPRVDEVIRKLSDGKDDRFRLALQGQREVLIQAFGGYGTADLIPLIYFDHKIHPTYDSLFSPDHFRCYPDRFPVELVISICVNY